MSIIRSKKCPLKGSNTCLSRLAPVFILLVIMLLIAPAIQAQHAYQKNKAKHFKSVYKSQINYYANACSILDKKKHEGPRHNARLAHVKKPKYRPMPGADQSGSNQIHTTVATDVKPEPVPANIKAEENDGKTLETLHQQEDQVLVENLLPVPTSVKHEEIRKQVVQKIQEKKDLEPLDLAPLYFNFNEDEFSVVDMEPFLVAVEYALQGKHVLIEGHTDSRGAGTYNVQLSIKRVQKIRQLMIDMGVPDDRISVVGYGEEQSAKVAVKTDGDHQNHRRVDFKVF
jgi:outer membrane protein OmpA-like peptidoglycan-associated protein